MHRFVALLLALVAVSSWSAAHAEEEDPSQGVAPESQVDRWTGRPLAVFGVVGTGAPGGWVGGAVEYGPVRWFVIGLGAGAGWYGPQVEGHARFEIPLSRALSLGVGGGFSGGAFKQEPSPGCIDCTQFRPTYEWDRAYWANGELSLDGRTESGFSWRVFFGAEQILNPHYDRTDSKSLTATHDVMTYYLGAAFGYAFEL